MLSWVTIFGNMLSCVTIFGNMVPFLVTCYHFVTIFGLEMFDDVTSTQLNIFEASPTTPSFVLVFMLQG